MNNPVVQRSGRYFWILGSVPLVALLVCPILYMLYCVKGDTFIETMRSEEVFRPLRLSFYTSALATLAVILLGTPIAYLLGCCQFRGRVLLEVIIELPTVLPPAVAGLALLLIFGRRSPLGSALEHMGVDLAFTIKAVMIAQVFVAAPYFIKAFSAGLAAVDSEMLEAAALDGANSFRIFLHILLPNCWRGFVGGIGLCWARALGEFGATIIFAGNSPGVTQTMPLAIYLGFETDYQISIALSAVMLAVSFGILLILRTLMEKREG